MAFDSTRFIAQVTLRGSLPEGRFEDQEILDMGYDCLLAEIVPAVMLRRQEYYVAYSDIAIVGSQEAYDIPTRALGGVLREVKMIVGNDILNLERKGHDEIKSTTEGTPVAFYLHANTVRLNPVPSSSQGTLRLYYFMRPSKLVPVSECARVTAISGSDVTCSLPATWTAADTFDIVKGRAHFDMLAIDQAATSVAGGIITFASAPPSSLAVGDYVCLSGETCFPYLPPEAHSALVQATITAALESIGDPAAANSAAKTTMLVENMSNVMNFRVQGEINLGRRLI